MLVHTPTLFLVMGAIALLAAGAVWLEAQRTTGRPLTLWLGAYLSAAALAISSLVLFPRDLHLAIIIPNGFGVLAMALMYAGLADHLRRPFGPLVFLPVLLWVGVGLVRWQVEPPADTYVERRLVICVLYVGYAVAICRLLVRAEWLTRTKRALIAVFALYGAFYALRLIMLSPVVVPDEMALDDFWLTFAIYKSTLFIAATAYLFLAIRRERSELGLRQAAEGDPLTGLPNRRSFRRKAEHILESGRAPVLCLIDLDHFKAVNDTCGHAGGDAVLCAFADVLRSALRHGDVCGRLGGEEFGLLFHEETPQGAAQRLAAIADRYAGRGASAGGLAFATTFSAGVSAAGQGDDLDEMMARADTALYCAKRAGRDRVEVAVERHAAPMPSQFAAMLRS